ncbi:unnamed protein product [Blepharisma stoltei]|uniref:Uncharacterized protein n=1 Tax=Blepharisma stoltei TaxID=1481888 RepID=A0AAU9J4Q3_9CILI|nr:unnamed protein product [Blepharisma stoltei]
MEVKLSKKLYDDEDSSRLDFLVSLPIWWPPELIITSLDDFSQAKVALDLPMIVDENASMFPIPGNKIFCYGNLQWVGIRNDPRNLRPVISGFTFIINEDFSIEILNEGPPCYGSGGTFYDGNIYIFGGHIKTTESTCEASKYNLQEKSWKRLASLPNSTSFSSCIEYMGLILIAGISSSKKSFAYNIELNSYSEFLEGVEDCKILCKYEGYAYLLNPAGNIYESEYKNPFVWKIIKKFETEKIYEFVRFQMVYEEFFYFVEYVYGKYHYYRFDLINKEIDGSSWRENLK